MPFNFKNANVGVRENRLGSITGFSGDLETLAYRSQCGSLKNRERCFSQSSSCLSGCARSEEHTSESSHVRTSRMPSSA